MSLVISLLCSHGWQQWEVATAPHNWPDFRNCDIHIILPWLESMTSSIVQNASIRIALYCRCSLYLHDLPPRTVDCLPSLSNCWPVVEAVLSHLEVVVLELVGKQYRHIIFSFPGTWLCEVPVLGVLVWTLFFKIVRCLLLLQFSRMQELCIVLSTKKNEWQSTTTYLRLKTPFVEGSDVGDGDLQRSFLFNPLLDWQLDEE